MESNRDIEGERKKLQYHSFAAYYAVLFAITTGYYFAADMLSRYVFSGLSLYVFGILAGISGGIWGFGVQESYNIWREIRDKTPFYSPEKFSNLLAKFDSIVLIFGGIWVVEGVLIYGIYKLFIWG